LATLFLEEGRDTLHGQPGDLQQSAVDLKDMPLPGINLQTQGQLSVLL